LPNDNTFLGGNGDFESGTHELRKLDGMKIDPEISRKGSSEVEGGL
jgi:hypothetical protein